MEYDLLMMNVKLGRVRPMNPPAVKRNGRSAFIMNIRRVFLHFLSNSGQLQPKPEVERVLLWLNEDKIQLFNN